MNYIDVEWLHEHAQEPVRLVSELDDQRNEVRKLEFFRTGAVGSASAHGSFGNTRLSEEPLPDLNEINSDPQFRGVALQAEAFEELWRRYAAIGA
jgi:hypothetical protein